MLGSRHIGGAVGWITRGDRSMTSFFGHTHIRPTDEENYAIAKY